MTYPTLVTRNDKEIVAEYLKRHGIEASGAEKNETLCEKIYVLKKKKAPKDIAERSKAIKKLVAEIRKERMDMLEAKIEAFAFRPLKVTREMELAISRSGEIRVHGSKGWA